MEKRDFEVSSIFAPLLRKDGLAVVLSLQANDADQTRITLSVPTEAIGDLVEDLARLYAAAKVQAMLPTQDPHPDQSYRPTPDVLQVEAAELFYHKEDSSVSLQIRTLNGQDKLLLFDSGMFQQIYDSVERREADETPFDIN